MKVKPPEADGRRAEFEALYARHSREVWALAYARWMDADLALDIAQEAFLRLWKHWEAGEEDLQNPRAWLLRVARNLAEDYAKSCFRRNGTTPPQLMNGVSSREPLPLDSMEKAEAFVAIRATLDELPPGDREILTLRYALEYDATKIAELLGINATAVHMRLEPGPAAAGRPADGPRNHGDSMSMNTRIPNRPDDEIDRLFTAYFQAQLPANWPDPPRPWADRPQPAAALRRPDQPSRWALAASVRCCWGVVGICPAGRRRAAEAGLQPGRRRGEREARQGPGQDPSRRCRKYQP